ncbi:ADP-ribosylation factor-like protein 2, partial [Datura stramonium]|nr:ADP-ribosylation factor-like protein 2 [Datura stramonium]
LNLKFNNKTLSSPLHSLNSLTIAHALTNAHSHTISGHYCFHKPPLATRKLGVITMGLLSIIRKIKQKEKEIRILMVGLDNSGKTTIVLKINSEDTSVISPTLGFNIKTITYQKYSRGAENNSLIGETTLSKQMAWCGLWIVLI